MGLCGHPMVENDQVNDPGLFQGGHTRDCGKAAAYDNFSR